MLSANQRIADAEAGIAAAAEEGSQRVKDAKESAAEAAESVATRLDLVSNELERGWTGEVIPNGLLLRRMVAAGRLGRKTGQGFHVYA